MKLKSFPSGVHPHDYKEFSKDAEIEIMDIPKNVVIPLSQHIGAPSKPIVKLGDEVKTGQVIMEAGGFVSIPQHASISGKITKIANFPNPDGTMKKCIQITSDGKDQWIDLEDNENFMDLSIDEMKNKIQKAGICGMGGAGFPTHVKLSPPKDKPIDTVILNGVECEPFLTADYRVMLEKADQIILGLKSVMKIVDAKKGIIGIEANKPKALKLMQEKTKNEENIEVISLKVKYPQGAEVQLIYAATKRKVPSKQSGGLPMDIGVVVQNVGTVIAIYEALRFGKPFVERVVTITGSIVKRPANYQARIGTLISDLLEKSEGVTEDIGKVISGGPMMGFAIPTVETPISKTSSGIVFLNKKMARQDREHTCLRCGRCVDVCPLNLVPSLIQSAVKGEKYFEAEKAGVVDCMRCGSCAYVCPSHIKLIQWIDIGKQKVYELNQK